MQVEKWGPQGNDPEIMEAIRCLDEAERLNKESRGLLARVKINTRINAAIVGIAALIAAYNLWSLFQ